MIAKENIYLTAERNEAVGEGSDKQAFLLVASGCHIDDELAKKFDIKNGRTSEKKKTPPKTNKAKKKTENKSK